MQTAEMRNKVRGLQGVTIKSMELIHYGAIEYNPEKFEPIRNGGWFKPSGGLWTSPVNSKYGWKEFCESETNELGHSFELKFHGKVLTIDKYKDLEQLPWYEPDYGPPSVVWKIVKECGVDAVHLTLQGFQQTRLTHPYDLYTWDCETVLVMNPECISPK